MKKSIKIENHNVEFVTIQNDDLTDEYMRYSADNWLKLYGSSWEDYNSSEDVEKLYQEYKKNDNISSTHITVPEEYAIMDKVRKTAICDILTHFYAAFDKTHDFDKALIFSISKYIENKYGFVDAQMYDSITYREQANEVINEIGENYNPFRKETYTAIRYIK